MSAPHAPEPRLREVVGQPRSVAVCPGMGLHEHLVHVRQASAGVPRIAEHSAPSMFIFTTRRPQVGPEQAEPGSERKPAVEA